MRVLITGANGFIGRNLTKRLATERVEVIGAGRSRPKSLDKQIFHDFVCFRLEDKPDFQEHLRNVDVVVHLAARVHVFNEAPEAALANHRLINMEGTRHLAEEAARAGVKKFVFISSIGVNGKTSGQIPFTEESLPNPAGPYGISKYEAEIALKEVCAQTGMKYVVLRPPLVYGPGATANMHRLIKAAFHRFPFPLSGLQTRRSFIYIDNLTDAIWFCLQENISNETFLVADAETIPTREMIRKIGQYMNREAYFFWAPLTLLKTAAALTGRSEELRKFIENCEIDASKLRTLGWRPKATLDDGLRLTIEHFLHHQCDPTTSARVVSNP